MVYEIQTCSLLGMQPQEVKCEVDLSMQLPSFSLIGLPSTQTQESKERVRAAIQNSGYEWPSQKVTINLLPATLPKWGSHFELPMALGVLGSLDGVNRFDQTIFAVGELSLDGTVRACQWLGSVAQWLENRWVKNLNTRISVFAHPDDLRGFKKIDGIDFYEVHTLKEAYEKLCQISAADKNDKKNLIQHDLFISEDKFDLDPFMRLREVKEEPLGVLAVLIGLCSRKHVLFVGPHGRGKSMLAQAFVQAAQMLCPLSDKDREQLHSVYFGLGLSLPESIYQRPVVFVQSSVSRAGLEGAVLSNGQVYAGEFSRAHFGYLIIDEFSELRRDALESIRQPIEERLVRLQRARLRSVLPADFQLIATSNLCACGGFGLERKVCRCSKAKRIAYQLKLSGPILDRFDMIVQVARPSIYNELNPGAKKILEDVLDVFYSSQKSDDLTNVIFATQQALILRQKNIKNPIVELSSDEISERGKKKIIETAEILKCFLNEGFRAVGRQDEHYSGELFDASLIILAKALRQNLSLIFRETTWGY